MSRSLRSLASLALLLAAQMLAALLLGARSASADAAAGERCANSLSPLGLRIYRAAAPDLHADTDITTLLKAKVRPMVDSKEIDRATARPAAQAAGACLAALRG